MIDVVRGAHAEGQAIEVVNGRHDVIHNDVLGDQVIQAGTDQVQEVLLGQALGIPLVQQLLEHGKAHLLGDTGLLRIKVDKVGHIHHAVGEYPHQMHAGVQVVHLNGGLVDPQLLQLASPLPGEHFPRFGHDLSGGGVSHREGQLLPREPGGQGQFFVELIAAHGGQVIPPGIEEQGGQQALGGVHRGGLAGTQLAVDLQQSLLVGLAGVFLQSGQDSGILPEHVEDFHIGAGTHSPDQTGDGQLAVLVDADIEHVGQVRLVLQPGPPVGDDGGGIGDVVRLVRIAGEVHPGGADDLRDDDTLRPVDDEGARVGHDGEIPHEDLLLLDLSGLLVAQAHLHFDGLGVGGVLGLALLDGVLGGIVHGEADEG